MEPDALLQSARGALSIDDFHLLLERDGDRLLPSFASAHPPLPQDLSQRIYIRGYQVIRISPTMHAEIKLLPVRTGFSKGVMLTGENLAGNVRFGMETELHYRNSRALAFLPLAHAYGCAFDMLTPLAVGSHITLLGKTPAPRDYLKRLPMSGPTS